jgi:hypothetical protein
MLPAVAGRHFILRAEIAGASLNVVSHSNAMNLPANKK